MTTAAKIIALAAVAYATGPGFRKTHKLPLLAVPHRHHN